MLASSLSFHFHSNLNRLEELEKAETPAERSRITKKFKAINKALGLNENEMKEMKQALNKLVPSKRPQSKTSRPRAPVKLPPNEYKNMLLKSKRSNLTKMKVANLKTMAEFTLKNAIPKGSKKSNIIDMLLNAKNAKNFASPPKNKNKNEKKEVVACRPCAAKPKEPRQPPSYNKAKKRLATQYSRNTGAKPLIKMI